MILVWHELSFLSNFEAAYEMRILSDADIIAIISIIRQLQEKYR